MVITCPSCKRRFNLPADKVRARNVRLKCSRCKSLFNQDLAALVGVPDAKLTAAEEQRIAGLPARAGGPAAAPRRPPAPAAAPPPVAPRAPVPAAPAAAAPAAPAPHAPVTRPMPQVVKPAAPAPRVPAAPAPAPKPADPVIQGYESYAEAPTIDEAHREALARAAEAQAIQAELRAQQEREERAAEEAAAAQAAVDAAVAEAEAEAVPMPMPEPPPAEEAFAPPVSDELPEDLRAGLEAVAQGQAPAAAPPPVAGAVARPSDPRNQAAADLFGGTTSPSGRFALPGAGELEDVLLLSDEEAPGALRWVGIAVAVLLALLGAGALLVLARNGWHLDTNRMGQQIRHAFGLAPAVSDDAACVSASVRMPALVPASDGMVVVVQGTLTNVCAYSVSGVSARCRLDGPGGPWTETARPLLDPGASDLSNDDLNGKSVLGMRQEIADRENTAGVVVAGKTHEFWCLFSGAASPSSKVTQFHSTFEVGTP